MNQEKENGSKKRHGRLIEAGRLGRRRNRAGVHGDSLRADNFARRLSECLGRETICSRPGDLSSAVVCRNEFRMCAPSGMTPENAEASNFEDGNISRKYARG